jgi:hypothetical protein
MVGAVLQMVLFLWAMTRRSYMAVALPVMGALAAVSALAFWVGWTMFTAESEPEEEVGLEEAPPEP